MIWGQGDGSGLRAVDSAVGRIGQLTCWEHYNPLARYALMADGEQIHSSMYPGSFGGDTFAEQAQVGIRQHALESGCFVVNATAWLNSDQQAQIMKDTGCPIGPISSGCFTAIVSPQGEVLGGAAPGERGVADSDFSLIDKRTRKMDSVATISTGTAQPLVSLARLLPVQEVARPQSVLETLMMIALYCGRITRQILIRAKFPLMAFASDSPARRVSTNWCLPYWPTSARNH